MSPREPETQMLKSGFVLAYYQEKLDALPARYSPMYMLYRKCLSTFVSSHDKLSTQQQSEVLNSLGDGIQISVARTLLQNLFND